MTSEDENNIFVKFVVDVYARCLLTTIFVDDTFSKLGFQRLAIYTGHVKRD